MRKFSVIGVILVLLLAIAPVVQPGAFSRAAVAGVVSNISVRGNVRVEPDTVLSYLPITTGTDVDDEAIDEAIKALFQTGLFKDVAIAEQGSTLVISVVENPLINVVNFEGNEDIDDETLAKEVEVRERMIFTKARVAGDTRRILDLYQKKGFYNVTVVPKQIRLSDNRINLVFEVNEGNKTRIRQVNFEGNEAFSDGRLREVTRSKAYSWLRHFSGATTFDADRLEFDKEVLRRHYLKYGYADAQVLGADVEQTADGDGFILTFTVQEGPQYTIADVAINVGEANLEPEPLQRVVKTQPGKVFNADKVEKTVERMTLEAAKQGFVFAQVDPKIDRQTGGNTLNITYDIVEGPRTYVERIDIEGNTRTLDHVIRRELLLFEGDAFNRALVERARKRLVALDYFTTVEFKEEQGSAPDKIVLIIQVAEKSTGSLRFTAGYSSVETILGTVTLAERNLFGRGYNTSVNILASFKRQTVDFSITDQYFLGLPFAAGFDIFANRSDNAANSSFQSQKLGGALRAGFKLNDLTSVTLKALVERRLINEINPRKAAPAIIEQEGKTWKSALSGTLVYSDLDDPARPTQGFRGQIKAEIAGLGGDAKYASVEASAWAFFNLYEEKVVLKLEGNAGHIQPFTDAKTPIEDMFFKGGSAFRGFASAGIGPKQRGNDGVYDAIGAQTYAIATAEVVFPFYGVPEALGIEGVVFSDFGTVFNSGYESVARGAGECTHGTKTNDCDVLDTSAFRASIGAGIVWQSPFGPLRFDAAYPLLKQEGDITERFQFGLGTRF